MCSKKQLFYLFTSTIQFSCFFHSFHSIFQFLCYNMTLRKYTMLKQRWITWRRKRLCLLSLFYWACALLVWLYTKQIPLKVCSSLQMVLWQIFILLKEILIAIVIGFFTSIVFVLSVLIWVWLTSKENKSKFQKLAHMDSLTNIYNRYGFDELAEEIQECLFINLPVF